MAKKKTKKEATCTLTVDITYDPSVTDPDGLAHAMDTLMETVLSTPGIMDDYGRVAVGEFFPLTEVAADDLIDETGADAAHHTRNRAMTSSPSQSITLYYRDGRSDKVYRASIGPSGAGFVVNFAFGRRGSTLQSGTKTAKPVDYASAVKIYDKLVRDKTAKGYTPGEDGVPYQSTDREAQATGIFPQLLNAIDEGEADALLADDSWWMQEKFDGKRIIIRKDGGQVVGINRKGLVVALPGLIAEHAARLPGERWLIDGEALGDRYVAFDLLERDGADLRGEPYRGRLDALHALAGGGAGAIAVVETAASASAKKRLLTRLRRENREGVVFKRADAKYVPGRPTAGGPQLKLKFTATASCLVARVNGAKRSVALELLDGGKRIAVGNVTVPVNQEIPPAGSVVDVKYLYAFFGGSLFQPVCLGVRDDVGPEACILSQLRYKAGEDEA